MALERLPISVSGRSWCSPDLADSMDVISLNAVLDKTSLSRPTIYHLIRKGEFPSAREVGTRSVWEEEAVSFWIQNLPCGTQESTNLRRRG